MTRPIGLVVAALFLMAAPAVAYAKTLEKKVERGIDEYTMGEFKASAKTLSDAVRMGGDNVALARAQKFLAAARSALGDRAGATEAIVAALKLDPTTAFDKGRFPAAIVELFREVKRGFVGKLRVTCDREDATVKVVGQETGSCNRTYEVPAGEHKVEVSAGGKTERRKVFVDRGATREVAVRFAPVLGTIVVTSTPPGATLALDGGPPRESPFTFTDVPPGPHVVDLRLARHKSVSIPFTLGRGETRAINAALVKEIEKPLLVPTVRHAPSSATRSAFRRVSGWTLVGVGVAAFAVAVANQINLATKSSSRDYVFTDVDSLNSWKSASPWIFAGAAVSAGAGTLILLLRGKAKAN